MTRRRTAADVMLAEFWRSHTGASKTELIRLRVEPEFKARVEAEAARRGMSVSAWITGLMKRSLRAS